MKYSNYIGFAGAIILIIASVIPWVYIESKDILVTGVQTAGTNYGKPALMNLIMGGLAFLFFYLPKIWAKRTNIFCCAFNMAWAVRNFIVVSACYAGECPIKQTGIYLLLVASIIMLAAAVFPDLKLKKED